MKLKSLDHELNMLCENKENVPGLIVVNAKWKVIYSV